MDPFYLGVALVVLALAGTGIYLGKREDRRLRALFARMAPALGAAVEPSVWTYTRMRVPHREDVIVVGAGSGGKGSRTHAYASAVLEGAPRCVLAIRSRNLSARIDERLGFGATPDKRVPAVRVGNPGFRRRFLVQSDAPELPSRVLNPALQESLVALAQRFREVRVIYREAPVYAPGRSNAKFAIAPAERKPQITLTAHPLRIDEGDYRPLIDAVKHLVDALRGVSRDGT